MRPFRHCLYFICERKFYARRHGKITRQWKSTLTLQHDSQCAYSYYREIFCVNIIRCPMWFWKMESLKTHFQEERDIVFTSDFCDNHSHPASPASLYLTSPRPRPTRPRVPYLMSSSPSSRVPKSQVPTHASRCPRPLVPVPLLYTATTISSSRCLTPRWRTHISKNVRLENIHVLREMLLTGSSCKLIGKLVSSVDESFAQFYNKLNKLINIETRS